VSTVEHRANHQPLVPPGGIECLWRDMTVIVSADVTLASVQTKLAEQNQWLPIDGNPYVTVGQLVSINSTGPLRLGYGAWRDLLLGGQFFNGRDELVTAGGRTVKNVAGYDLTKFMVGQRGVFGRLVTITSRTYRKPAAALLATFTADERHMRRLMPSACRPQWAVLTPNALLCGYLSDERTIQYYEGALAEHRPTSVVRRSVSEDVAHRHQLWQVEGDVFRASVPPANVMQFTREALLTDWAADAAFGIVVGRRTEGSEGRLFAAAKSAGGKVWFTENDGVPVYNASPAEQALLRRLKLAFDPDGKLAPLGT
jgi:glycolate oxidase FAD binding subunit